MRNLLHNCGIAQAVNMGVQSDAQAQLQNLTKLHDCYQHALYSHNHYPLDPYSCYPHCTAANTIHQQLPTLIKCLII